MPYFDLDRSGTVWNWQVVDFGLSQKPSSFNPRPALSRGAMQMRAFKHNGKIVSIRAPRSRAGRFGSSELIIPWFDVSIRAPRSRAGR